MKILDRYILFTFVKTFLSIFLILMFIMLLQSVWLYIQEFAGKDLDISIIGKLLLFVMPRLVVIVLPLSILLASIMVFGNFAENYEFAAMKSTGISLQRAMQSLIVFIVVLGGVAFLFANYAIPAAEFEFLNLRRNIRKVKPAMAISKGQFNLIGNDVNIKVQDKYGENDQYLKDVVIHQKQKGRIGNFTVIKAKTGEFISNKDAPVISLQLQDGYYYSEIHEKDIQKQRREPFAKSYFETYTLNVDLSDLDNVDFENKEVDNAYTMLNVVRLNEELDIQSKELTKDFANFGDTFIKKSGFTPLDINGSSTPREDIKPELIENYDLKDQVQILEIAKSSIKNNISSLNNRKVAMARKVKRINKFEIAIHEKYVLAFSCIVLFFVGAPLGAIIRKGGIGLPIVVGVLIFLTFHFVGIFAKNGAEDDTISPFIASWLSTFIMLPLGVYFTYRATTDQGLFDSDLIMEPLRKLFGKKKGKKVIQEVVIPVFRLSDDQNTLLDGRSANQLKEIVKNYRQFDYPEDMKWGAIERLGKLGITIDNLKVQGFYENKIYSQADDSFIKYKLHSRRALLMYILTLILPIIIPIISKSIPTLHPGVEVTLYISSLIFTIVYLVSFYLSFKAYNKIYESMGKKNGKDAIAVAYTFGFLFYFVSFFYFKNKIKEDLQMIQ